MLRTNSVNPVSFQSNYQFLNSKLRKFGKRRIIWFSREWKHPDKNSKSVIRAPVKISFLIIKDKRNVAAPRWRWRIAFTVRHNRISGEECLADKCHDNDRLGLGGRITPFHHPTPDYADRPILRGEGRVGVRLFADLPRQMISSHDNHFAFFFFLSFLHFSLPLLSPLFFHMDHTRSYTCTHTRAYPDLVLARLLDLSLYSFLRPSFPQIRRGNLSRGGRDERERERYSLPLSHTCSSYEVVTRRHLSLYVYHRCKGSFIEFHRAHSYYFPRWETVELGLVTEGRLITV